MSGFYPGFRVFGYPTTSLTEVQKLNNDLFSIKETLEQEIDEVKIDLKDTRKHLKVELNELHKHYNNLKKHYDGLKNFLEILLN